VDTTGLVNGTPPVLHIEFERDCSQSIMRDCYPPWALLEPERTTQRAKKVWIRTGNSFDWTVHKEVRFLRKRPSVSRNVRQPNLQKWRIRR
jgi:hypothetical protein